VVLKICLSFFVFHFLTNPPPFSTCVREYKSAIPLSPNMTRTRSTSPPTPFRFLLPFHLWLATHLFPLWGPEGSGFSFHQFPGHVVNSLFYRSSYRFVGSMRKTILVPPSKLGTQGLGGTFLLFLTLTCSLVCFLNSPPIRQKKPCLGLFFSPADLSPFFPPPILTSPTLLFFLHFYQTTTLPMPLSWKRDLVFFESPL